MRLHFIVSKWKLNYKSKRNKQKILQYKQILECGPKNCYSSRKKNERYNQKHIFFSPILWKTKSFTNQLKSPWTSQNQSFFFLKRGKTVTYSSFAAFPPLSGGSWGGQHTPYSTTPWAPCWGGWASSCRNKYWSLSDTRLSSAGLPCRRNLCSASSCCASHRCCQGTGRHCCFWKPEKAKKKHHFKICRIFIDFNINQK